VEEVDVDSGLFPNSRQCCLRAVQRPQASKDSSIFVTVTITNHHELHEVITASLAALLFQAAASHRMLKKDSHNLWATP
jgi:hypothetical protein